MTPHPVRIYSADTPDRATPEQLAAGLLAEIPPSGHMARLATADLGIGPAVDVTGTDVPVTVVSYGDLAGLPDPAPGVWYIVPLLTGLAAAGREDLLVPHEQVRNVDGTVVGCRAFGTVAHG
ncbi:hypothetical protein ABZ897_16325 [Nonomuraea sp. NPDC046802]|uniref:hypothetical protein n=1 Tax=Nonomuraea sp. NPDC046802 TaxID=3154919 RepID=UPI00340A28D3